MKDAVSRKRPVRVMAIVAHQDDFEFNAGGTFAQLRRRHGDGVEFLVVVTSRGTSGHHEMAGEKLFMRRMEEARESAALIGARAECLKQLDGTHVAAQVLVNRNLLGGIWNAIRSFGADYLFCPPVASDPLAGVHVDHEETARAIRLVGYQLGVPRAYPALTQEAGVARYRSPLMVLCDDVYNGEERYDVANPIEDAYAQKVAMAKCHRSQIYEWLPFNRNRPAPSETEFEADFQERHRRINLRYGKVGEEAEVPREYFRFSRWGRGVTEEDRAWLFGAK